MMRLCPFCEEYARNQHNYCRMCGAHLTAHQMQRAAVNVDYEPSEKYCGQCGRVRSECSGAHEA